MRQGDKNGIYIVDLQKNATSWLHYVYEQAAYMQGLGLDPDAADETPMRQICYGHLQHSSIQPMYGRSGDVAFQNARNAWGNDVKAILSQLIKKDIIQSQPPQKEAYISPFDGSVK